MNRLVKVLSCVLLLCLLLPYTALASETYKDENGGVITVDDNGCLIEDGKKLSGLYHQVYYQNGEREISFNGIKTIEGFEYCLRQGKAYTGVYGNRYYKNGVWCPYINGTHEADGVSYSIVNGEVSKKRNESAAGKSIAFGYHLRTGPFEGMYYEGGRIDYDYTGAKTYLNQTYYVEKGKLFDGYFDGCFYKDGRADASYSGLHEADGKVYCFMAGYFFSGFYDNVYYIDGLKSSATGYTYIDNIRYYLVDGEGANGVFDGAYFKNGLIDTSVNGKLEIDGVVYTFTNGITSDGLHDGKWYENGVFAEDAEGVKKYNGTIYYIKNGVLGTGVAEYKGKLRYFRNGRLAAADEWLTINGERYYFSEGTAVSGLFTIEEKEYLFDEQGKLVVGKEAIVDGFVYITDENGVASLAPQIFQTQREMNIPYPHSAHPNGTIASSGCGVCSTLMIIENETANKISLEEWTAKMLENGCRDASGTNMLKAAELLEKEYKITCKTTDDNEVLKEHLRQGYLAVASVGKIPLFSLVGHHLVVIAGMKDEDTVIIKDPNARPGKYGTGTRADIIYNEEKDEVYASFDTLYQDSHYLHYFLFTPTESIALRKSDTFLETENAVMEQ